LNAPLAEQMKIVGLSCTEARNVGDRYASPLRYFQFPGQAANENVRDRKRQSADIVILGGGSLARHAEIIAADFPKSCKIAWGIGHTQRDHLAPHDEYKALLKHFDFYGIRDWGLVDDEHYVPCASCMLPHFDRTYEVEHEFVFYGHEKLSPLTGMTPRLTNSEMDIDKVMAFLGSGETIVTSSYHGMYWGTLLGRKVIAIPFGSKFFHFKYPVPLCSKWEEGKTRAQIFPEALCESRERNQRFYEKVIDIARDKECAEKTRNGKVFSFSKLTRMIFGLQ
jgi:hypothetical protein